VSKKPESHEAMDAETFDLDGWIDEVHRPTVTVELYPREHEYAAEVAKIEGLIPDAERVKPEDRGANDVSPESLLARLEELRAERSAGALRVEVRQVLDAELAEVRDAYDARESGPDDATLWIVSAATVEPHFTPAQLGRLKARDRSGESMVAQLARAVTQLQMGLPVPSSPAPSDGSRA